MELNKLPEIFSNVKTYIEEGLVFDLIFTDFEPQTFFDTNIGINRKKIELNIENCTLNILNNLKNTGFSMKISDTIEIFIKGCEFIGITLKLTNPLNYVTKEGGHVSGGINIPNISEEELK